MVYGMFRIKCSNLTYKVITIPKYIYFFITKPLYLYIDLFYHKFYFTLDCNNMFLYAYNIYLRCLSNSRACSFCLYKLLLLLLFAIVLIRFSTCYTYISVFNMLKLLVILHIRYLHCFK